MVTFRDQTSMSDRTYIFRKIEAENMNERNRLQMISDLADWIDKEILAEALMEYLEDAYCEYDIENEVTLSMLKELHLCLLQEFGEHAKSFVKVKVENNKLA